MIKTQKKNKELAPLFNKPNQTKKEHKTTANKTTSPAQKNISIPTAPKGNPTSSINSKGLGLGVSLKSLSHKDEQKNNSTDNIGLIDKKQDTPFDLEKLQNAWIAYTNTIEWDRHYKNALFNCCPQVLDGTSFEILLDNQMQAEKLEGESVKVTNFLREYLKNSSVTMNVRIDVNNERKIAFTSIDKYKLMIEENESLKLLKDKLNLELL